MGAIAAVAFLTYAKLASPDAAPAARYDPPLIYDAAEQQLVLFGGADPQNRNDLWRYSIRGQRWDELKPAGSLPAPRFGHTTVYDPVRRRLILFGGQAGGFFSDVWAYDIAANQWTQLAKDGAGPASRYGHSAIYDSKRDRMVVSHGFTTSGRFDDTWSFDLVKNRWANITPSGAKPLKRCLHHAAFNERGDQFLLFGGCSSGFGKCPQDDLWSFDLNQQTWKQLPSGPPARERYALAFDSKRERLIIFGGSGFSLLNDTWVYDVASQAWSSPDAQGDVPSPRSRVEGIYAEGPDAAFWFGGSTESGFSSELFRLNFSSAAKIDGVVNAFSGSGGGVAPGELVSIFGSGLGQTASFGGTPATVYFGNSTQVNVRVPEELRPEDSTVVTVGSVSTTVKVVTSHPGIFPSVFHANGSVNSAASPAADFIVVFYATGIQPDQVKITVAGKPAEVLYAAALAGAPGVIQVNLRIPDSVSGSVPLAISGGNTVNVFAP